MKEAQAARLRREGLLSTLEQECAEQGQDWEDILEQAALEKARLEELELTGPAPQSNSWLTGNGEGKDKEKGQEAAA